MKQQSAVRTSQWVGQRVRERRKALGLTQAELASRTARSTGAVSRMENGETTITIDDLFRVSLALKTDMEYFLSRSNEGAGDADFGDFTIRELGVLYRRNAFEELFSLVEQAAASEYFRSVDNSLKLACWKARALFALQRFDEAIAVCTPFLSIIESTRDKYWVAYLLHNLAISHELKGDYDESLKMNRMAEKHLSATSRKGSSELRIRILLSLGVISNLVREFDSSEQYLREGLRLASAESKVRIGFQAHLLLLMSHRYSMAGDPSRGLQNATDAFAMYEFIEDIEGMIGALNNMAWSLDHAGRRDEALPLYARLATMAKENPEYVLESVKASLATEGYFL